MNALKWGHSAFSGRGLKKQNVPSASQRGFILMPVIVMITLLATVIFLLTRENASGMASGATAAEKTRAMYVAEAGIEHAIWQAREADCGTYSNLVDQPFGNHSYSVTVAPTQGSPIYLHSTSKLSTGAAAALRAVDVPVYSTTANSSIVLQPGPEGKDAYIDHNDKNYGAAPIFQVKNNRRALLQFDLSELPAGSIVTDARLALFLQGANSFENNVFSLHRLSRDWVEGDMDDDEPPPGGGVTWDEYDGTNKWTTRGGDYDAAPIASITLKLATLGWKEWAITDQVQAWHEGDSNYGLLLLNDDKRGPGAADTEFTSGDGVADQRPKLTVTYAGCECGKNCSTDEAQYCDADFEAITKDFEFDWMPGTNTLTGIDFLPESLVINGTTIPAGGGWIMADNGEDAFFVTDSSGTTLTSFPVGQSDVRGVAYIDGGAWIDHLAFADNKIHAIYFVNLDGVIMGSISTEFIAEEPFGLTLIRDTESGTYDNHLAFTSQKNGGGEIYILDQNGALKHTINVDSYAPKPQGVAHLPGADKLMVTDLGGVVSIIDFDGVVLQQYDTRTWLMPKLLGAAIHPETCEHIILDSTFSTVSGLSPYRPEDYVAGQVLMVAADASSLTTQETARKDLIESWSYQVTAISDDENQAAYDAAVAASDVVYINEDASAGNIQSKLVDAPIGVVAEEPNLTGEFGLSTATGWSTGSTLNVDDNSHYITLPFATGPLQVLNVDTNLADLDGTPAPGLRVLASAAAGPMLATLEANAERLDTLLSAGRRAQLPWGGSNFRVSDLTIGGETIFQRSLEWGAQPPPRCDADFVANTRVGDFAWMPDTGEIHGIDYVPPGVVVNSVTIPAGGGWVMSDNNNDRLFITDLAGNTLTDFAVAPKDAQGVAFIDDGTWRWNFAVADKDQKRLFILDLDGGVQTSFDLTDVIDNQLGLGFINTSASAAYDNHLLISSDKDISGGGTATVYIVDQWGRVERTIDVEAFASTPLGVTHVNGRDELIVSDKTGVVSVVDFDGNLLHQYSGAIFGLTEVNEIAVNPNNCDHVFMQKMDFENIVSLNRVIDTGPHYIEMYMPWSVTVPDTWETVNLEIYGVEPNAVLELAIINSDGNELWGGARAAGSSLERRVLLHRNDGGTEIATMHVQADSLGRVELYADKEDKVKFVLLGYWTETSYVENMQSFKAGANNSWSDHALNGYGVGPNDVAEILMVNNAGFDKRMVGVRSNGSSLSRQIELHEAEDGGSEVMSMLAAAGPDAGATVEVYAQLDADIDFYLLGHWSTPPGTYTSAFENLGSAGVKQVWEDVDLSAGGVPANAVAQILATNNHTGGGVQLGVRAKDSIWERLLDLHKAEYGGPDDPSQQVDAASMHVSADADGVIEWYDEDVDKPHHFYLLGWWTLF